MRRTTSGILAIAVLSSTLALTPPVAGARSSPTTMPSHGPTPALHLPWREAGLSEREAAAFMLERLTYGARPGEVDRVVAMGVDRWLERQLAADLPEPDLGARLAGYGALSLTLDETFSAYPPPGLVLRQSREAGVIPADFDPQSLRAPSESAGDGGSTEMNDGDGTEMSGGTGMDDGGDRGGRARLRRDVLRFAADHGYHRQRDLVAQLQGQKLVRAVYAENQLAELMTDFWFNHFNVSTTDNQARVAVLAYERDAIRPHVLGRFRDLLGATAKHPAMLLYLDNARSVAAEGAPTTADREVDRLRGGRRFGRAGGAGMGFGRRSLGDRPTRARRRTENPTMRAPATAPPASTRITRATPGAAHPRGRRRLHPGRRDRGGARLHRLDARAAAGAPRRRRRRSDERHGRHGGVGADRALRRPAGLRPRRRLPVPCRRPRRRQEDDPGTTFPAGRGIEDGEAVLDLVASHSATAHHLASKIAVRFVSDDPPPVLVERLATAFLASGGDVREVLRTLFESPDFWRPETRRSKIKSPLELAASALRALGADLTFAGSTVEWIAEMGEPLYACQAPTGFPDRAEAWLNAGTLLNRINFATALAAGKVAGVKLEPGLQPTAAEVLGSPDFQRR